MFDGEGGLLAKLSADLVNDLGDNLRNSLGDLQIINMPDNGALLPVNCLVGY